MGVLGDLAGHRAHHQPVEAARAARAHDDHVGVLPRVDELLDREAVNRPDRDGVRARSVQPGQHLVGLGLSQLTGLLGPGRVIRVDDHRGAVTPDALAHGDHRERHLTDRRFAHGPSQGALGMTGTVHPDDNSRHFPSPSAVGGSPAPPVPTLGPRDPLNKGRLGSPPGTLVLNQAKASCLELT